MKKYAVFTMDVEAFSDTECISATGRQVDVDLMDGLDEYIRILDKYGIKSTLFTVGQFAPKIADRIREYTANGHRLALHSHRHVAPMALPLEAFREETRQAKNRMSQLFGVEVEGFRAPCFSLDKDRLEVLRELGFRYDSSHLGFLKARHTVELDLSGFQKLREGIFREKGFYEFGLAKQNILGNPFPISGGGYVRLGLWEVIKTAIRQYIRKNTYYVFYLHPFELTRRRVPCFRELKFYDQLYLRRGIRTYGNRVERIIEMLKGAGYTFVTFEQLVQILNREKKEGTV